MESGPSFPDAGRRRRRAEAKRARKEALGFLTELGEAGERKSWSNILSWWTALLALSGRSAEPAAPPRGPAPPFARPFLDWSPDIKQAYFDDRATVEQEAAALGDAARTDPHGRSLNWSPYTAG
ncbi:hypothetical protein ABZ746_30805 [Streptomyces sp. NPDC020096]